MNVKVLFFVLIFEVAAVGFVKGSVQLEVKHSAMDNNLLEEVIDAELCHEQIRQIRGNSLLNILFADAGIRTPRGILEGNNIDLGNYHQCIGINQQLPNSLLEGKYCMIRVPMNQSFELPSWPQISKVSDFDLSALALDNETIARYEEYNNFKLALQALSGTIYGDPNGRTASGSLLSALTFRLAVCIPKPCTTQQAITSLLFNITAIGFQYTDEFCRLPGDKPWVPGDYVAITVFSILGFITILSTSYDIWHTLIKRRDLNTASVIGKSFSVYTNGRRLMSFTSGPATLECLDGIRAISIAWIMMGHEFTIEPFWANPFAGFQWQRSYAALWMTGGHVAVDTFFTLSGLLVVYTTAGKVTGIQLLKNIHLFYLNRLLRMFPLLAACVLLEATYMNRITDGPVWSTVANHVESCRTGWWSTLLHVQNYVTPTALCMVQTWYLAIDVQLHILSPIVLVFVLSGKRKLAWGALAAAVLGIMISSTTYNFIKRFPANMGQPGRAHESLYYLFDYYLNTLTRAPPFVIGMVFGYLIHLSRRNKVDMTKLQVGILWTILFAISSFIIYTNYPIIQLDWDNQTLDSCFNSFVRSGWAVVLGFMIFACVTGYGGPVNWFLSLNIWKLPARISYAMYLTHYMLMLVINHAAVAPMRFSIPSIVFKFLAHYALCFAFSFFMTLIVDSPFSTLFKMILGAGAKKSPRKEPIQNEVAKEDNKEV